MVYKSGAFAAGQMAMVVKAGKVAEARLRAGDYANMEEKNRLMVQVETGKDWERMLEKHKKAHGL
jgi:hypothetical protein